MRALFACLATMLAVGAAPAAGRAQPVSGLYMSGSFGAAFPHSRVVTSPPAPGFSSAPVPSDPGPVGQGSIGYGLGNGLRLEMQGTGGANRLRLPQWP